MKNFLIKTTVLGLLSNTVLFNQTISAEVATHEFKEHKQAVTEFQQLLNTYKNVTPGSISIKYEVGGRDGGYISSGKGDAGGKSYGVSQFTSKGHASANSFVKWICSETSEFTSFFLNSDVAGTDSFDKAWKDAFNSNSSKFTYYQQKYTLEFYVNPFIDECKNELGVDFNKTLALQEAAYSLAVQFGKNGALTIARNSGLNSSNSEEEIIKLLYSEKRNSIGTYKFLKCSKNVQEGVFNRFINEEKDILDICYNTPYNSFASLELETF
ncbi:MAG: hypothetical protein IJ086_16005 [Clostridium sp.]|nr:hypothetical protein [Clostridium sp.]MBQ9000179.1 hypothetical protein [Clostridium sp.]